MPAIDSSSGQASVRCVRRVGEELRRCANGQHRGSGGTDGNCRHDCRETVGCPARAGAVLCGPAVRPVRQAQGVDGCPRATPTVVRRGHAHAYGWRRPIECLLEGQREPRRSQMRSLSQPRRGEGSLQWKRSGLHAVRPPGRRYGSAMTFPARAALVSVATGAPPATARTAARSPARRVARSGARSSRRAGAARPRCGRRGRWGRGRATRSRGRAGPPS